MGSTRKSTDSAMGGGALTQTPRSAPAALVQRALPRIRPTDNQRPAGVGLAALPGQLLQVIEESAYGLQMPSPSRRPSHGTGGRPLPISPPPTTAQLSTDSRKTQETAMEMRCDASPSPSGDSRVPAPGNARKTTCLASSAPRNRTVAPENFSQRSGYWRSSSGSSPSSAQWTGNWSKPSPLSMKSAGEPRTNSGRPCERSAASASSPPHHTNGKWWRWRRSASHLASGQRKLSPLTMMDPPSAGKGQRGAVDPAKRCQAPGQPCGHSASGTSVRA